MPGRLEALGEAGASGWARHPVHAEYRMTVHALLAGRVTGSVLADGVRPEGVCGFVLPVPAGADPDRVQILLGETGEVLAPPRAPPRRRLLTVEDLIATPVRRPWITGLCHLDAERAGLRPETIVDLLCRDHLGRAAGQVLISTALAQRQQGGYDGVRRMFLESSEYRYRRIYAAMAPGAIFSQRLILSVAARDFTTALRPDGAVTEVSAAPLLRLEGEAFVAACYRRILRKEADRAGLSHYLQQLAAGVGKAAIIRHLGNEFETISAGIVIVDLPEEAG